MNSDIDTNEEAPEVAVKPRRRRRWLAIGALAFAGLVTFGVLNSGHSAWAGHKVTGTLTLTDSDVVHTSSVNCEGSGGYDDVHDGMQVTFRDGSHNVLADTALVNGIGADNICVWYFTARVPDASFYSVGIGGGRRGELNYSKAELERQGWKVDVTLGSGS